MAVDFNLMKAVVYKTLDSYPSSPSILGGVIVNDYQFYVIYWLEIFNS
jgi:hypothetical protein